MRIENFVRSQRPLRDRGNVITGATLAWPKYSSTHRERTFLAQTKEPTQNFEFLSCSAVHEFHILQATGIVNRQGPGKLGLSNAWVAVHV